MAAGGTTWVQRDASVKIATFRQKLEFPIENHLTSI